jgi:1-acyl-sn-glycerol-3-phosphate acyltransferase
MIFYWLTHILFKAFAKIFFRLEVEGLENLPQKGAGFILASNHASSIDPFIIVAGIPRYIRWLVIYEYYDLWYLRWILKRMRFIRIENNLPKAAFRTLLKGGILGMFPEGRRTWSGQLGQPREGTAILARRTHSAVVPLAILGSFKALPRTRKLPKPHPVRIRIGPPLYFSAPKDKQGLGELDQQHSRQIMQAIAKLMPSKSH